MPNVTTARQAKLAQGLVKQLDVVEGRAERLASSLNGPLLSRSIADADDPTRTEILGRLTRIADLIHKADLQVWALQRQVLNETSGRYSR